MKLDCALPRTFQEALQFARRSLAECDALQKSGSLESEAEQLVCAAFRMESGQNLRRFDLLIKMPEEYPSQSANLLAQLCQERKQGQPLQYLTGYQVFLNHEYRVRRQVLIPRPETEILVVTAQEILRREFHGSFSGVEVGLGTGIISIELLSEFSQLSMRASEVSQAAHECALENAAQILKNEKKHGYRLQILTPMNSLEVLEPFIAAPDFSRVDFIITNPPYLLAQSDHEVEEGVRLYEPHLALFSPPHDSVYFYRKIAEGAAQVLKPQGYLFAELPHERSNVIVNLFKESNWETEIRLDLTGRERVLIARLRS